MEYGYWSPVFGGWLRNVEEEGMEPTFEYVKKVAQSAERWGYSITLVPELYLNDIKGPEEDALEAWTTAAALAAVTEKLKIIAAVRPGFHNPAVIAKMAANIDHISHGRFILNVVSSWWEEEAREYGGVFAEHDERYERTKEFVDIIKGLWLNNVFTYSGKFYQIKEAKLAPKPVQQPYPLLYAGGESERGKETIAATCDAYVMHGGTVEEIAEKVEGMKKLRQRLGKTPFRSFGMAAYVICRDTEEEAKAELARITQVRDVEGYAGFQDFVKHSRLEIQLQRYDYSVSNRGLRPNLIGTPEQIADRILQYEQAGLDLLLLQFSPQWEEMERFAKQVMPLVAAKRPTLSV